MPVLSGKMPRESLSSSCSNSMASPQLSSLGRGVAPVAPRRCTQSRRMRAQPVLATAASIDVHQHPDIREEAVQRGQPAPPWPRTLHSSYTGKSGRTSVLKPSVTVYCRIWGHIAVSRKVRTLLVSTQRHQDYRVLLTGRGKYFCRNLPCPCTLFHGSSVQASAYKSSAIFGNTYLPNLHGTAAVKRNTAMQAFRKHD